MEASDLRDGALSWDVLMKKSYEECVTRHSVFPRSPPFHFGDSVEETYSCFFSFCGRPDVTEAWFLKWMVPLPKDTFTRLADLRPIMLMEVLWKLWTGLIVRRILFSSLKHNVLGPT